MDAAIAVLVLAALCFLFYGPWQEVCTDYARQVMFEKRDALFDMARRGELDFGSYEYRTIRSSMEKTIRFSHELTLPRFFMILWLLKRTKLKKDESELVEALETLDDSDIKRKVAKLVAEAHLALILMAMAKSPLTVLLFLLVIPLIKFQNGFRKRVSAAVGPLAEMAQMEAEYAPSSASDKYVIKRAA